MKAGKMNFSLIELFANCGGTSYGFSKTGNFEVLLGTDIDAEALTTFRYNHYNSGTNTYPATLAEDINRIDDGKIWNTLAPLGITHRRQLDCMVGGPPCEGFSQNKRLEYLDADTGQKKFTRASKFVDEPRNFLFRRYLELAKELMPKTLIIENVPQIITHNHGKVKDEIENYLSNLGYAVRSVILNAADYGVPQIRKRAFFICCLQDDAERLGKQLLEPVATHVPKSNFITKFIQPGDGKVVSFANFYEAAKKEYVTVKDAIEDLPSAIKTDDDAAREEFKYPEIPLGDYAKLMRSPNNIEPYNHIYRTPGEQVLQRLRALKPGMRLDHLNENLRTKSYYFNAYGRLNWEEPAKTITKSCNYLGSGCFGHPELDRGITMREAARLQSFDDNFRFLSSSEPHIAKMIGSAVPPLLAKAIGYEIASYLTELQTLPNTLPKANRRYYIGQQLTLPLAAVEEK
jgi:DNA (cytosine-5)-methyltransferase 1